MRITMLSFFLIITLILPISTTSYAWDFAKEQIFSTYMIERPNETYPMDPSENDVINRDNFYQRHAGHRQEKRYEETPEKNLNFEVYKPPVEPATKTKIVEKDGRAVTEISINKESEINSQDK